MTKQISETEKRKTIYRVNETDIQFFKNINQIDKPLVRKKRLINEIRNKSGDITIHFREIEMVIREFYKQLHTNKLDNLDEINKWTNLQKHTNYQN